jgi:hypothetical protein
MSGADEIGHEVRERMARVEGRLDGLCDRLEMVGDDAAYIRDRVDRIDRVSAGNGAISGAAAAIGIALLTDTIRRGLGLGI